MQLNVVTCYPKNQGPSKVKVWFGSNLLLSWVKNLQKWSGPTMVRRVLDCFRLIMVSGGGLMVVYHLLSGRLFSCGSRNPEDRRWMNFRSPNLPLFSGPKPTELGISYLAAVVCCVALGLSDLS